MTPTPLLDQIDSPADMKDLSVEALTQLAEEVRQDTIAAVSQTGGHLGAGLGVVELTVALHHVFNTPDDRLIWDVGHQAYPHKILTGRRGQMNTIRQPEGISGFTKRSESEYDPFGAGHSSTSISAGLGMAVARDMTQDDQRHVVCVIGDGAMSAGMAYEAMNNAGHLKSNLIVILNDNDMSIAPPTGAMSQYLSRLVSSKSYSRMRNFGKKMLKHAPQTFLNMARRAEANTRNFFMGGGTVFEEMGFYYIGPIDGHNLAHLVPVLKNVAEAQTSDKGGMGPVLIHVRTEKGRGFEPSTEAADKCHAVSKFDLITGQQVKKAAGAPGYSQVMAESLVREMTADQDIVAITAAMPGGTKLDVVEAAFPSRVFDVGIAEQHAVTFAAGLAAEGKKPFCALYSTFLQRAYDQVVHDVAIQNLPVRFPIDRAGLVGADGATHAGAFDLGYLCSLPNMVVMAASDEVELAAMVKTAAVYGAGPIAFRYPRGEGTGAQISDNPVPLDIGKGRVVKEGTTIAILSLGTRLDASLKAAEQLEAKGLSTLVADMRFAKPVDADLIQTAAQTCEILITIEEGAIGGFSAQVNEVLIQNGLLDSGSLKVRNLYLPDVFQDQNTPDTQYAEAGLDAAGIVKTVMGCLEGQAQVIRRS